MRKATLTVIFSVLLFMLSLVPSVLAWAQPTDTPHEDPNRAEEIFQLRDLISSYSILLEFVAYGKFTDTDSMVELLGTIDVPDEIQSAIDIYHSLTRELSTSLSSIKASLDEAEDLIDGGFLAEAEAVLAEVEVDLGQIKGKIDDMANALENMREQMGNFITDTDLFEDAYNLQHDMFVLLSESKDYYQELYLRLYEVAESEGLPTDLSLILPPDRVWVGEQIAFEGTLNYIDEDDNSIALPGREIIIRLGESALVSKVLTDANGYYTGTLDMPYSYTASIMAKASYEGGTEGEVSYRSSHIESEVSVGFFETDLELDSVPTRLLSGYPFSVSGAVTGDEVQVAGREIQLNLNGEEIGTGYSETGGAFELDGVVPADFPLGNYQLLVKVEEDNSNKNSGASQSVSINISQDLPDVVFNSPGYVFASSSAIFDGNVSYNGVPVENAVVSVVFAGSEYSAETNSAGYFEIDFELPLSLAVVINRTALVYVQPEESWLGLVEMERDFTVLSPLSIGFFSLAMIASGVVAFSLTKKRRRRLSMRRKVLADDADSIPLPEYVTERDGVLAVYDKALAVMQELTGTIAGSNMTLRDYVNKLDPKLGRMKQVFAAITSLVEIVLYSAKPDSSDEEEANGLLAELTQELINESA